MAGLKAKSKQNPRAMLNTTIRTETLDGFKSYCKEIGMPMNMILEAFMEQFIAGEFVLKIGKANKLSVDMDDVSKEDNSEENVE